MLPKHIDRRVITRCSPGKLLSAIGSTLGPYLVTHLCFQIQERKPDRWNIRLRLERGSPYLTFKVPPLMHQIFPFPKWCRRLRYRVHPRVKLLMALRLLWLLARSRRYTPPLTDYVHR